MGVKTSHPFIQRKPDSIIRKHMLPGRFIPHILPYPTPSGSTLLLLETSNKIYKEQLWIEVLSAFASCLLHLDLESMSIYIKRIKGVTSMHLFLEKILKLLNPGNEGAKLNVRSDWLPSLIPHCKAWRKSKAGKMYNVSVAALIQNLLLSLRALKMVCETGNQV